jgi:hypothetical protein
MLILGQEGDTSKASFPLVLRIIFNFMIDKHLQVLFLKRTAPETFFSNPIRDHPAQWPRLLSSPRGLALKLLALR